MQAVPASPFVHPAHKSAFAAALGLQTARGADIDRAIMQPCVRDM